MTIWWVVSQSPESDYLLFGDGMMGWDGPDPGENFHCCLISDHWQGPVTAAAGNVIHGDNINHRPPPAHSLDIAGVS